MISRLLVLFVFSLLHVQPAIGKDILIVASGQSNMARVNDFNWNPPSNLFVWDNYITNINSSDDDVGTHFHPWPNDKISVAAGYASEVAKNNPTDNIYLVQVAWRGLGIEHWLDGVDAYPGISPTRPDMYKMLINNLELAKNQLNTTHVSAFLWWQGEAHLPIADGSYSFKLRRLDSSFRQNNELWNHNTKSVIFSLNPLANGGRSRFDTINRELFTVVNIAPKYRYLVFTGRHDFSDGIHIDTHSIPSLAVDAFYITKDIF